MFVPPLSRGSKMLLRTRPSGLSVAMALCFVFSAMTMFVGDALAQSGSAGTAGAGTAGSRTAGTAGAGTAATSTPIGDKWALVIGISKFADGSMNLTFPAKDAKDFAKYLVEGAGFAPDHVRVLINEEATRERILSNLGDTWLPRVALSDDLVVIFISSHGSPSNLDVGGLNYIVAHNTSSRELYATGIPIQELCRILRERVRSKRVVLLLDACHSGSANPAAKGLTRQTNFNANEIAQGTGQLVICSSEPGQLSWESRNYTNSVFTRQLIDCLKQTQESTGIIGTFSHLRRNVEAEVARDRGESQTPVMKTCWAGSDISLAVKVVDPRPGIAEPKSETGFVAVLPPGNQQQQQTAPIYGQPTPGYGQPTPVYGQPNTAVTQPPPVVQKPTVSAASVAGPGKYAILPFSEPVEKDIKGWYKASDVPQLAPKLQQELAAVLAKEFGRDVAPVQDVNVALTNSSGNSSWVQSVGRSVGAKYLIGGKISRVSWRGKVMTGNEYNMVASVQVISAETGQVLWTMNDVSVKKTSWVKDQAMGMGTFFLKEVTPAMAEDIAKGLSKVIPK